MAAQTEQAAIQAASDTMAGDYALIAGLALLSYDTVLTISHEIQYIWNKKIKLGTALYVVARYSALLFFSLEIFGNFFNFTSLETCDGILHSMNALNILPLVSIQGLLLARAYAVSDQKRAVLGVLGALGGCATIFTLAAAILDRCDTTGAPLHTILILGDVDATAVILFDTVVVAVTLVGTLGTWRVYKRSAWNRLTLTHLLAEQSLMRFGFVLTLSLADTILLVTLRPTLSTVLSPMQQSLSAIIICRFHLDLQRRNAHPNSATSLGIPTISLGSFHAATRSIHDAVMAEFGDSPVDEHVGTEASLDAVESTESDMPAVTTENDIELEEIQSRPQAAEIILEV